MYINSILHNIFLFLFCFVSCKAEIIENTPTSSQPEKSSMRGKIGGEYEFINGFIVKDKSGLISNFKKAEVILRNDSLGFEVQSEIYPNTEKSTIELVTDPFELSRTGISNFIRCTQKVANLFKKIATIDSTGSEVNFNKFKEFGEIHIPETTLKVKSDNYTFIQLTFPLSAKGIVNFYHSKGVFRQYTAKFTEKYRNVFVEHTQTVKNILGNEINLNDIKLQAFVLLIHNFMDRFQHYGSENTLKNGLPWLKSRTSFTKLFKLLNPETQNLLACDNGRALIQLMSLMMSDEDLKPYNMKTSLFEKEIYCGVKEKKRRAYVLELDKETWLRGITKGFDLLALDNYMTYFPKSDRDKISTDLRGFFDFGEKVEFLGEEECAVLELRRSPRIYDYDEFPRYVSKITNFIYELNYSENVDFDYDSEFVF